MGGSMKAPPFSVSTRSTRDAVAAVEVDGVADEAGRCRPPIMGGSGDQRAE
jgi:hypothetical protein